MRVAAYHKNTFVDGEGVRNSLYVSGCLFRCKGCYNEQAQSFNYGDEYSDEFEAQIIEDLSPNYIDGLSLVGGDPFAPRNAIELLALVEKVPKNKTIWAWSGFDFEDIVKNDIQFSLLKHIDVLIDGQFKQEEYREGLYFRGSKNQRVIDVQKSLKNNKVCLYKDGEYLEKENENA